MLSKYSNLKKFNRFKRFLLNSENKYELKELIINWLIWISIILIFLFGSLFAIYSQNVKISGFNDIGVKIPEPANTFFVIAFVFLIINLTVLILKIVFWRKRLKREKG